MGQSNSRQQGKFVPYIRTGKPCSFADSGEFRFRMNQLKFIDYIIHEMDTTLCSDKPDFVQLVTNIQTYHDVLGRPIPELDYVGILANDPALKSPYETVNKFGEILMYFEVNGGKPLAEMKADFLDYLDVFIRLRNYISDRLLQKCT